MAVNDPDVSSPPISLDSIDEFNAALGGDVVIPGSEQIGGLSVAEILATRGWFDSRGPSDGERA